MSNEVNKEAETNPKGEETAKPATDAAAAESTTTTEENADNTSETVVDKVANAAEAVAEKIVETVETVAEAGANAVEKAVEPVVSTTEAKTETPKQDTEAKDDFAGEPSDGDSAEPAEMDFGAMLEQFEQDQVTYHAGELVKGKVVGMSDNGALVDFGYKSEGTVSLDEFTTEDGVVTIKQGDEVEVVIKSMGSGDSPPSLSRFDAERRKTWNEIEDAFNDEVTVKCTVTDKTKGGLKVDVKGVEAFLPGSQIDSRPVRNLDALIGQEIEAKVIKFSRKRNNIVLSRKVITDEVVNKLKAKTLERIKEGFIEEGTVKNLTDYGAFVDIGGIDGLLHVTDMSWGRLHNPGDMFKVGESVQVKILKLDREKEKVSLGFKQLMPDPWSTVTELYPVDSKIQGRVSSVTEYGAFVELEPGVEGLVHVSEMSWSKRLKHPKHLVKKGDEVEVQVLGIDPDERRISLGIKQLQDNPWDTIAERYQVGSKIEGKVRNLTDFGAFVEVEDGVDGLVHVSDISWSKKIKHPKDVLKKGQEVEAVVTNIDVEGRRLSLSIKELTPSAWDQFTTEHKPGNVIKGTISRFASFGVFVELAPDLEGLCHISELSDDRIENPEDEFEIGQELDFKILRIEHDVEKIGLSHRSVGKEDEPGVDSRSYSSEAKGGMASLGELANLNIGGSAAKAAGEEEKADKGSAKAESKDEPVKAEAAVDEAAESSDKAESTDKKEVKPVEAGSADEVKAEEAPADKKADEAVEAKSTDEVKAEEAAVDKKADETAEAKSTDEVKAEEVAVDKKADVTAEAKSTDEVKAEEVAVDKKADETAETKSTDEVKAEEAAVDKKSDKAAEAKSTDEVKAEEAAVDKKSDDAVSDSGASDEAKAESGDVSEVKDGETSKSDEASADAPTEDVKAKTEKSAKKKSAKKKSVKKASKTKEESKKDKSEAEKVDTEAKSENTVAVADADDEAASKNEKAKAEAKSKEQGAKS